MKELMDFNFWEMIVRTTVAFGALLVLARILGKKQMSQLTFFHYITGIAFGSIAAEMAGQTDVPFIDGLIALIWWAILTLVLSYISLKSSKLRVIIEGEPTIIIRNGILLDKALKKARLHMDDVMMMLREQSVFSIQDVHYGVLETNGELSVMKKASLQEPTKADVKAPITEPLYIPSEIISDGKIVVKNLQELKLTEEWVMKKLKKQEINTIEEVFYAQIQSDGSLYVDIKSKQG
ncbi:YetF domain-containing protein [Sporosarcina siberiensis]|uniref:YetF domain-containing protein n=1 Tax=Sporosarcina siberiensis TaxID=1365606 RepID=A0ABW4SJQ0_9BACL